MTDDTFKYAKEDDFLSDIDYHYAHARTYELSDFGVKVPSETLRAKANYPAYNTQTNGFHARSIQLANILLGKLRVSSTYKDTILNVYLNNYSQCNTFIADLKKESAQNKNIIPQQAAEFIQTIVDGAATRFRALGYEHKQVEGKWVLEKVAGANGSQNK